MSTARRILAINASYRDGGATDQAIAAIAETLSGQGVDVDVVKLRESNLSYCLNCRECMQQSGDAPGTCVLHDDMHSIIARLEAADGFVLASPTNFSSATALFKCFSERLAPYGYWPWGALAPAFRKDQLPKKPAILVSSSAAPGMLGRLTYMSIRQLRIAARTLGAKSRGTLFTGLMSGTRQPELSPRTLRKAARLAQRLA